MENQNNQAFEADQAIDALDRLPSRSGISRGSSHKGHDALKAVFGGYGTREDVEHDRTPLLSRDHGRDHDNFNDTDQSERDGQGPPTWEGERDFDGRPWWNKPSVRYNSSPSGQSEY